MDMSTWQPFHPVTLAIAQMILDNTKDVTQQVTDMLRSDRGAAWDVWLSLQAPVTPSRHVAT